MPRMVESPYRPADQAQRDAALEPQRSFIVQAPAGSGKTGLLTQRFLRLLATVEQPEEIVAITFTRKAATEMRNRILLALADAARREVDGSQPDDAYARATWQLARAALRHGERQNWNLLANPQRLRVRTIDSLCQYLARQMPLRSGFGEAPAVDQQAAELHRAAARSLLSELEDGGAAADALVTLLTEVDNDVEGMQRLVVEMLERRDQWLRHVLMADRRGEIERALKSVVETELAALSAAFPADCAAELCLLASYAADHLDAGHALAACRGLRALPPATVDGLAGWSALAGLLLTQKGEWRKSVTVADGFPPGKGEAKASKDAMQDLLERLQPDAVLGERLYALRNLPDPRYTDPEWTLLQALFSVLLNAVAHLQLVFREQGRVDFAEIALAAQHALGGEGEPTDLALRLDYAIRHLLVDEFQDTSQSQHELLTALTRGWEPGDGRTLFLVGDPMQSIYRFRKAEVGLFLNAWQGRLGELPVTPLRLRVNFRSERGVIDWVNEQFARALPAAGDPRLGAVPYAPSVPFKGPGDGLAVEIHPFIGRDDEAESARVIELVHAAAAEHPVGTTAVLVRSKAHLDELIQALRGSGLRYQAVEIGALAQRPAVLDLLALTLALLHPADRVSWLALLHGPLCGLALQDLHALTGDQRGRQTRTLPDLLHEGDALIGLSADGRARITALLAVVDPAQEERGRRPLRSWVEGAWLALGGPATLPDAAAGADAEVYLRFLLDHEQAGRALTREALREGVDALFALPDPEADDRLQLMTIHKAKGLEFDTVILPGLGKTTRGDGRKLLYWLEAPGADEAARPDLFFGPLKPARSDVESRTTGWIRGLQKEQEQLENGRLLYVAATRARRRLHLLGHAVETRNGELSVRQDSLLARLWPALEGHWEAARQALDQSSSSVVAELAGRYATDPAQPDAPPRRRLPSGWACPAPPAAVGAVPGKVAEAVDTVVYEWAGDTARAVGTVVHRWLQRWAGSPPLDLASVPNLESAARRMLLREGVPEAGLETAWRRVRTALDRTLADERGRWILSPAHAEARCEIPLSAVIDGQLRHLVIDRSFVDSDGVRWIIDYKTGRHEGGEVGHFLDEEEQRYREQLAAYAAAFRALEGRPVRSALYFPLVPGGWRELAG